MVRFWLIALRKARNPFGQVERGKETADREGLCSWLKDFHMSQLGHGLTFRDLAIGPVDLRIKEILGPPKGLV